MDKILVIAGPCVIESEENAMYIAEKMKEISERLNIDYYLPIQRKKESKPDYYYDWDGKRRNYSKSWKSNTKCRKQWMKHLKD